MLVEGEVCKQDNSFCRVFPIDATSDASIVDKAMLPFGIFNVISTCVLKKLSEVYKLQK